jgi:hypothetical protein
MRRVVRPAGLYPYSSATVALIMANEPGVLLYRALDLVEASLIQETLRASGIPAVSAGGNAMTNEGLRMDPFFVEIWVPADRLAEAAELVERSLERSPAEGAAWTCSKCGESNEPGFDLCWSCGAGRAGAL